MRRRQRGVAIITALLVVMLAAGIAAYLLSQQSRALTRAARATERAQAMQYAAPTLDWARSALFQLQKSTPRVDLTQPWARGLAAIPPTRPPIGSTPTTNLSAQVARKIRRICRCKAPIAPPIAA